MKSLRILIASSFLLTACSLSPQEAPTTPVTAPTSEQEEEATPSEATTRAELFLVDLEDNGANGALIGCGDSLVSVPYTVSEASSREDALVALLQMPKEDPETGFYNALAGSNLTLDEISTQDGSPILYLTGNVVLGGACDAPRVEEQLMATFLQGEAEGLIYVNDILLQDVLSSQ
jgi:hypothetical protein